MLTITSRYYQGSFICRLRGRWQGTLKELNWREGKRNQLTVSLYSNRGSLITCVSHWGNLFTRKMDGYLEQTCDVWFRFYRNNTLNRKYTEVLIWHWGLGSITFRFSLGWIHITVTNSMLQGLSVCSTSHRRKFLLIPVEIPTGYIWY